MALPDTMRVIAISEPGGPEVLVPQTATVPSPSLGEVLIKIAYAGVNRPDALQRAGLYNPPKGASPIPGLECAGTVAATGRGVSWPKVGDQVCALLPGGGYADYATTPATHCLPIPAGLSMDQAACLPETFFTVWSNVFQRGGLKAGERFLIHGGSSGIGTTAIQLAKHFGARVFATARTDAKCVACKSLGAEQSINYTTTDFVEVMKGVGGADVILDMVGGPYIARNLNALADDGRLVQIAFLQGPKIELNAMQIMTRRLTLTGSTLRPRSDVAKARIAADLKAQVWPLIAAGRIAPVMDQTFVMTQAQNAHARMESGAHIGKIVLRN